MGIGLEGNVLDMVERRNLDPEIKITGNENLNSQMQVRFRRGKVVGELGRGGDIFRYM